MGKRLLIVWYAILILSVVELVAYGVTGYVPHGYRTVLWDRFNENSHIHYDVDKKVPYAESINRYAHQVGINPQVIVSVIQAESSFQPRALSAAGAYGLMQIMPDTWRQVNKDIKVCISRHQGECSHECYYNADLNIQIGTHYLAGLLEKYQGNMIFALAAYNAGPGAVDYYGGVPPYAETIKYTETVAQNYYEIRNEKTPYSSFLIIKTWEMAHRWIGWCFVITVLVMVWVVWRLVKLRSSWYWR